MHWEYKNKCIIKTRINNDTLELWFTYKILKIVFFSQPLSENFIVHSRYLFWIKFLLFLQKQPLVLKFHTAGWIARDNKNRGLAKKTLIDLKEYCQQIAIFIRCIRIHSEWKWADVAFAVTTNMVQYHDTIRMVNFINPPSTIGIVVDLYPLYSASLPVVPVVRYGYGSWK
jgi:hypothetical protein